MSSRAGSILRITLGLLAAGVLIGAVLGIILAMTIAFARNGRALLEALPEVLLLSAMAGGALGGTLAPITAWLLLRRVALGRAMLWTAGGTLAGAALGAPFGGLWWLGCALSGYLIAALVLWITGSDQQASPLPAGGPRGRP